MIVYDSWWLFQDGLYHMSFSITWSYLNDPEFKRIQDKAMRHNEDHNKPERSICGRLFKRSLCPWMVGQTKGKRCKDCKRMKVMLELGQ